jgi:hypothetical protein
MGPKKRKQETDEKKDKKQAVHQLSEIHEISSQGNDKTGKEAASSSSHATKQATEKEKLWPKFKQLKKAWKQVGPHLKFGRDTHTKQKLPHESDCPECGKRREPIENNPKAMFGCMVRTQILHCVNNHYWFPWHSQVLTKEEALEHGLMWDDNSKRGELKKPTSIREALSAPVPAYYYGPVMFKKIVLGTIKEDMTEILEQMSELKERRDALKLIEGSVDEL